MTRRADYERRSKLQHLKRMSSSGNTLAPTPPPYHNFYKQRAKSPKQLNSQLSSRDSLTSKLSTSHRKQFNLRRENMTSGAANILAHPSRESRLSSRSEVSTSGFQKGGESKRHYRTAGTLEKKLNPITEQAEDDYIYQDVKFINEGEEVTKIRYVATPPPPTYEEALQEEKELNDPKRKKQMRTKHFYRIPHKLKQKLRSSNIISRKELDGLSDSDSQKEYEPKREYGLLSRAKNQRKLTGLDISGLYKGGGTKAQPVFKTSRAGSQPAIDSSRFEVPLKLPALPAKQKVSNSKSMLESQRKQIRTGGFSRL